MADDEYARHGFVPVGTTAAAPAEQPPDPEAIALGFLPTDQRPGALESFGRGMLEGGTFGFEAESGLADQARQEASRAANPWTHFAGEMIGGLVPMGAAALLPGGQAVAAGRIANLGLRAGRAARAALVPGEIGTTAQAAVQGAKLGATYGALSGAGHTDTSEARSTAEALGQRAVGSLVGGGTGAVLGAPLGVGLYGGSRLIGAVANRTLPNLSQLMEAASTPEMQGIRDIVRQAGYDNYTIADFTALRDRLRDPAQAHLYRGLNLIEALETRPVAPMPGTGELRPPVARSPSLREYAQDISHTAGTGRHEAIEAFANRQNEMSARIQDDVGRWFGAAPASSADDVARLASQIDNLTGAGDRAAVEARRLTQREAFNKRYDRLRSAPLELNEGLADLFHHPDFKAAVAYAANNDILHNPGAAFGQAWARAYAQGLEFRGASGITLSPANITDIHHSLVMAAKPNIADPQRALNAGILKRRFADWADERLRKYPKLRDDYAMFKRAMEAEDMGGSLPLVTGGRGHESMQFLNAVTRDEEAAARVLAAALPRSEAAMARWRAGVTKNEPRMEAARNAMARSDAMVEVQDSFRRAWGEAIKEQFARATDPAQVATMVRQMLSPAGRERIQAVLGNGPQPAGRARAAAFIQELTLIDARNHGMSLGLAAGGGDHVALQFLARNANNPEAISAFRQAWGERIRQEIGAATSPAQVNAVVNRLLSQEGKSRIMRLLGPTDGRQFIESLYNKAQQAYFSKTLYGGSDTAYKTARQKQWETVSDAIHAAMTGRWWALPRAVGDIGRAAYAQRRADQGNLLLARQGPTEVGNVLDTILARQQLRTTGQPYLGRWATPLIGPGAGVVPVYQNPPPRQRRRP